MRWYALGCLSEGLISQGICSSVKWLALHQISFLTDSALATVTVMFTATGDLLNLNIVILKAHQALYKS